MDWLININCFVDEYHDLLDIVAKFGVFVTAIIAFNSYRQTVKKSRYEFLCDLHKKFLNDTILKKRAKVTFFWKIRFHETWSGIKPLEVKWLVNSKDDEIKSKLSDKLGLTFIDINEDFLESHTRIIKETEYILNEYEHLAKLVEAGTIEKNDIKIFFYTMYADTFVTCLPFILYRRKSKDSYARKMQGLLKILPNISRTMTRV